MSERRFGRRETRTSGRRRPVRRGMFVEAPMIQAGVQEAGERARIRGECNLNRIEFNRRRCPSHVPAVAHGCVLALLCTVIRNLTTIDSWGVHRRRRSLILGGGEYTDGE